MTYAFGADAPLSAPLYATAFGEDDSLAVSTLSELCKAGAFPFSLSEGEAILSQGIGIPLNSEGGQVLYLYALATEPAARGQGLLRTLLKETAALARAKGYLALCLIPANAPLGEAYRRMGFTIEISAGASPTPLEAEGFSLFAETLPTSPEPISVEECYAALGGMLSPALFAFTLTTLPTVEAVRIGDGVALTLRGDPRYALAVSRDLTDLYCRSADHRLLAMPLAAQVPRITEPLPR